MGQGRLELPTSRLSGVRSNHLSYWPGWRAVAHASEGSATTWVATIANREECLGTACKDQSLVPENRVLFTTRARTQQRKVKAAFRVRSIHRGL